MGLGIVWVPATKYLVAPHLAAPYLGVPVLEHGLHSGWAGVGQFASVGYCVCMGTASHELDLDIDLGLDLGDPVPPVVAPSPSRPVHTGPVHTEHDLASAVSAFEHSAELRVGAQSAVSVRRVSTEQPPGFERRELDDLEPLLRRRVELVIPLLAQGMGPAQVFERFGPIWGISRSQAGVIVRVARQVIKSESQLEWVSTQSYVKDSLIRVVDEVLNDPTNLPVHQLNSSLVPEDVRNMAQQLAAAAQEEQADASGGEGARPRRRNHRRLDVAVRALSELRELSSSQQAAELAEKPVKVEEKTDIRAIVESRIAKLLENKQPQVTALPVTVAQEDDIYADTSFADIGNDL